MGVKVLQCFPWYRRCKDKERGEEAQTDPSQTDTGTATPPAGKTRLCSTTSSGSEGEHSTSGGEKGFFSCKARVSFRHEMDSTLSAIDATY
ncbi:uncharacterized protein C17orf114 isoform X1 [Amia ocellicauda]|uniref:uncharacterized protein C17orf114 isoform X1 n=1 Tax=Amia ocellicauda TaxID=2972642 RepID=UPI003463D31F